MPAPRKYSDELKVRAVRLRLEQMDRPLTHVAKDLGVHPAALTIWVNQAQADSGQRKDLLTTAEREELKAARKEITRLRKANEILKDASVYFAMELDPTRRR